MKSIRDRNSFGLLLSGLILVLIIHGCSSTKTFSGIPGSSQSLAETKPCDNREIQKDRSLELQKLLATDQADRKWAIDLQSGLQPDHLILGTMSKNDLIRRRRVGEIFGEGCIQSIADYKAASLIYQHGNIPDHFFQAYVWAQKAVNLGAEGEKPEVAMAIDRYLVESGHKELFGTQAKQVAHSPCFCIAPIEESFPEKTREEYRGGLNRDYTGLRYLQKLNFPASACKAVYCAIDLRPTPKGTVPGFW